MPGGKTCKKQCRKCGKTWGIVKKVCTCGNELCATNNITQNEDANEKECPKCHLKWQNAKRFCTCGHTFSTGKRKASSPFVIRSQKCRVCGADRKGHVCQRKPESARLQSLRSPGAVTPKKKSSSQSLSPSTPLSAQKPARRVKCVACSIGKSIVQLVKNCDASEVNVKTLETDLNKLQDQTKYFIAKLNKLNRYSNLLGTFLT